MRTYIIEIICIILTMIFSLIAKKIEEVWTNHIQNEEARAVIKTVVEAVEQICKRMGLHGEDKYNMAVTKATDILTDRGIKLTAEELNAMIEAAVNGINYRNTEGE